MQDEFQIWFKSTLFKIIPGEDAYTNPGCYGNHLANWLRDKLIAIGFIVEDVVPEDWGWCVLCKRRPFKLWVGCGSTIDKEEIPLTISTDREPSITWTCFVQVEVPLLARCFQKLDEKTAARELYVAIESILKSEPEIVLTPEP